MIVVISLAIEGSCAAKLVQILFFLRRTRPSSLRRFFNINDDASGGGEGGQTSELTVSLRHTLTLLIIWGTEISTSTNICSKERA